MAVVVNILLLGQVVMVIWVNLVVKVDWKEDGVALVGYTGEEAAVVDILLQERVAEVVVDMEVVAETVDVLEEICLVVQVYIHRHMHNK